MRGGKAPVQDGRRRLLLGLIVLGIVVAIALVIVLLATGGERPAIAPTPAPTQNAAPMSTEIPSESVSAMQLMPIASPVQNK